LDTVELIVESERSVRICQTGQGRSERVDTPDLRLLPSASVIRLYLNTVSVSRATFVTGRPIR
jgi:hypothetical protein